MIPAVVCCWNTGRAVTREFNCTV